MSSARRLFMRWATRLLATAGLALSAPVVATALATADVPFVHAAWGAAQDAPAAIHAIAQDKDGFLILGTGAGMFRFDGATFEPFVLADGSVYPPGDITALAYDRTGDLWVGYLHEGIARVHRGVVTRYDVGPVNGDGWISAFVQAHDGTLWASGQGGLLRWKGGTWQRMGADAGYPDEHAGGMALARDGTLWVSDAHVVRFLRPGAARFVATPYSALPKAQLTFSADGVLWMSDEAGGLRSVPTDGSPDAAHVTPPLAPDALVFQRIVSDADGNLWGTLRGGQGTSLVLRRRMQIAGAFSRVPDTVFRKADGLTSDQALPVFVDREGTVWVGTNLGLDSFRSAPVRRVLGVPDAERTAAFLKPTTDGNVWLGLRASISRVDASEHAMPVLGLGGRLFAAVPDRTSLWVLTTEGIGRFDGHDMAKLPAPPGFAQAWNRDLYIHPDGQGGVYFSAVGVGVAHFADRQWMPVNCLSGEHARFLAMQALPQGILWAAGLDGRVVRYDAAADRCQVWHTSDIGEIWAVDVRGSEVLVGGQRGIARISDGALREVVAAGRTSLSGITGIARTAGRTWFSGAGGIVAFSPEALASLFTSPRGMPWHQTFSAGQGLPGMARQADPNTLAVDTRGRLLIASDDGPAILDPANIRINSVPPHAIVKSVSTDAGPIALADAVRLPAGSTRIRVAFTATSLAMPTRVTFRYRMDGVDERWQNAGSRREAFYTNIGPGTYRFEVMAFNEDGIVSRENAGISIIVAPAFYQAVWFRLMCVIGALLGVAFLIRQRIRRTHDALRIRFEAASSERVRIARDLHDTLLQSVQGVSLMMSAATRQLPDAHPAQETLTRAIEVANSAVDEGREAVAGLRACDQARSMAQALERVAADFRRLYPTPLEIEVHPAAASCDPGTMQEVVAIVREALSNAFRHSGATAVRCDVEAGASTIAIRVRDDGVGFEPESKVRSLRHFGLRGMHERATRIRAELSVDSSPGAGTIVTLALRPGRKGWGIS